MRNAIKLGLLTIALRTPPYSIIETRKMEDDRAVKWLDKYDDSRVGGADRKLDSENKETTECIRKNRKN